MQSYQSSGANPDFDALHHALSERLAEASKEVAPEVPELGRPPRLVDGHDQHPGTQPQGPGVGRQLGSDDVRPAPEQAAQGRRVGPTQAAGDAVEGGADGPRV